MATSSLLARWQRFAGVIGAVCLSIAPCAAHPDLLEQIADLTQQLTKQGASSALYLERADLYRRHGEFDAALARESSSTSRPTRSR